jgi:hypothetical protein
MHNKKGARINDGDFALYMRLFGYFDIRESEHMELLGVLVKIILTHAANAIQMATTVEDLGQKFGEISLSKGKERAQDDPRPELFISGRQSMGGGRASSHSSSGRVSPSPGPRERSSNPTAVDSQVRRRDASRGPPSNLTGPTLPHHRNDELRPMTPRQADQRPPHDFPRSSANRTSSGGRHLPTGHDARPIPPHPDPSQRVRSSHRSSSTSSSDESESYSRISRSPLTYPERAMQRAAPVLRSTSSSPLRHGQSVRPSANHSSPADRSAAPRRPPLYPTGQGRSDSRSSERRD